MKNPNKCSVCGCLKTETPKFYHNSTYGKNLCNKHYLQLRRFGKITDNTSNVKLDKCGVCGYEKDLRRCGIEGDFKGKTLCGKHYAQVVTRGKITNEFATHKNTERVCDVCKKDEKVIFYSKTNQMLCRRHYDQIYMCGKILDRTMFDKNDYEIVKTKEFEFAEVILRNSKHEEVARTIIDLEDLDRVLSIKWRYSKSWGYATSGSSKNKSHIMLQNFILNKEGLIDHINRNALDNRKHNLMTSNKSLNALNCGLRSNNKSGVTGVSFSKNSELWRVYINWKGKRVELGYSKDKDEAIKIRLEKENELLGNLSPQKELFEKYSIEVRDY